jgi:polyhydroxyalkanoate synthesis regulator phasin
MKNDIKTKESPTGNKVFYVDVGDMSPDDAKDFVDDAKAKFKNDTKGGLTN